MEWNCHVNSGKAESNCWPVVEIRSRFPGLQRQQDGRVAAFFDGPAGSQVPECVAAAVGDYLRFTNCNRGAAFATSQESDAILDEAHVALADFVGTTDPGEIAFGANMTSLTLALSRAVSRLWGPGDEIIVTRLDHDANVTPWALAAADRGVTVRHVELNPDDWTLDLDDYRSKLSERTKLVAVGYASNATGTINPLRQMIDEAHVAGAYVFVDAVHYAPHGRIRTDQLDCDFLACSAYKFFGPHVGVLWGRRHLLEEIRPYKLRPAPENLPGRWMTGTQSHEGIAGTLAAVNYLTSLESLMLPCEANDGFQGDVSQNSGCINQNRSAVLDRVFHRIAHYEQSLSAALIEGLTEVRGVKILGITDLRQLGQRVPTVSFVIDGHSPRETTEWLARQGLFVWNGNHYALPFTESAGLEPGGTIRAGALHYNTADEIHRLTEALQKFVSGHKK